MLMKIMDYVRCWCILLAMLVCTFCIMFTATFAVHAYIDRNSDKEIQQTLYEACVEFMGAEENEAD